MLHVSFTKEFEDMNNSVTGASKGKGMKMQERLEKEQASAATQVELEGMIHFFCSSHFIY